MILDLAEVKNYLKIDIDDDDVLIGMQITAAEASLENATGIIFDDENKLAKIYCLMLVQDMYDNRTLVASEKVKLSATAIMIITQLQTCYEVAE